MATFGNRVRETTTVTGTGSATLLGAVTGWQAFNGPFVSSDQPYYAIVGQGTGEWEVGKATFTAPSTLARTVVLASSNSNAAVNFSAGTKDVWNDVPASIIELILTSVQTSRQVISGDGISGGGDLSADRTLKINAAPSTIASAATTDLGSVTTINIVVSGTTGITSFGTGASKYRVVVFSGALTITHNATSLILPGGANITTAAGDRLIAVSDASGNWTVINYTRAASGNTDVLLAGTAANNLVQLNGSAQLPAVDGSLLTGIVAGATITLLGTLTTTSGSTQSITSLTSSKMIICVLNGVSPNGAPGNLRIQISSNNGSSYSTAKNLNATGSGASDAFTGSIEIYQTGITATKIYSATLATTATGTANVTLATEATVTGVINAIRFDWSAGVNFDAGTIYVFGVN